jgi:hypothetical protein
LRDALEMCGALLRGGPAHLAYGLDERLRHRCREVEIVARLTRGGAVSVAACTSVRPKVS